MELIKTISAMKNVRADLKGSIGFIPTMGAIHQGHLSLVDEAKKNDFLIASIFVNPTQFGENEDLESYPQNIKKDLEKFADYNVDYVFLPTSKQMYPDGFKSWVTVDKITNILCGESRPNHFRGVTTIVNKLINIVKPDYMYMGLKDFQQIVVIETMIKELNIDTKIVRCPIIREDSGLAMSSRNAYLDSKEKEQATSLYKSLMYAKQTSKIGDKSSEIIEEIKQRIVSKSGRIDYVKIVDTNSLYDTKIIDKDSHIVLAVFWGNTRLIDNMRIYD